MSLRDFRVKESLGKGAFASVYKVVRRSDGKIYALKRVKINKMSKREVADALNEIRFLASVRQKNIVGFFEAFIENNETELCIIMEYCGCGDLSAKIERYKRRRQYIDEAQIWAFLRQLLEALSCLHSKGILHRDVKAANCFIAADGSVKLGDMNVSKRLKRGQLQTQIGTPYYMSPEIWCNRPYNSASDMWALGCLLYELCALRPPFTGDSFPALKRAVLAGRYPAIPRTYSADLGQVIASLLRASPRDRPRAADLLNRTEVQRRSSHEDTITSFASEHQRIDLIGTIKVPQQMRQLTNALPKPCYPDVRPNSPESWPVTDRAKALKREARAAVAEANSEAKAGEDAASAAAPALAPVAEHSSEPQQQHQQQQQQPRAQRGQQQQQQQQKPQASAPPPPPQRQQERKAVRQPLQNVRAQQLNANRHGGNRDRAAEKGRHYQQHQYPQKQQQQPPRAAAPHPIRPPHFVRHKQPPTQQPSAHHQQNMRAVRQVYGQPQNPRHRHYHQPKESVAQQQQQNQHHNPRHGHKHMAAPAAHNNRVNHGRPGQYSHAHGQAHAGGVSVASSVASNAGRLNHHHHHHRLW